MRFMRQFIFTFIAILCIGASPSLFKGINIHPIKFLIEIWHNLNLLLHPNQLTYGKETVRPLIPDVFDPFFYSMVILLGGVILSLLFSIVLAFITFSLGKKWADGAVYISSYIEAIPDIFVIAILQLGIVWVYKMFGNVQVSFVSLGTDRIYIIPIIILSILPSFYLFRLEIRAFIEENEKQYTEFALGKGLSKFQIIFRHIFRNTVGSLYFNSKHMIWLMLSNLFMVEYFFNMYGIMMFIYQYHSPIVLTVCLLLIFLLFYGILLLTEALLKPWLRMSGDI
ncbi:ABC-type dipeptide/oligopeptide/nickel transport system permease component [Scopulibacillus darangshiensis]|uniref:ABC-type dipeptide/oligopeptide/nickel transport system permease component n=1 Tax=Scopulibacillus darangshiensis TaxID=442528 RepID=A0A4R2P764_9BACL|nr:ABC transporter permease subunit [Scopulibacillus darangshiensis]TCP30014.1 ABC-type dipeptide/oligopeptide/nickel transport system permease component [Scopulibacillus darangshiensis]